MPGVGFGSPLPSFAAAGVLAMPYGTPAPDTQSSSENSHSNIQPRQAQPQQQQTTSQGAGGSQQPAAQPPLPSKPASPTCPAALQPTPDGINSMSAVEQQFLGSCPMVVSYAVVSASATPDGPFCATAMLTNNQQVGWAHIPLKDTGQGRTWGARFHRCQGGMTGRHGITLTYLSGAACMLGFLPTPCRPAC